MQEAALQALLGLDRLRQPERFGSWLGGIGLNVCRHWLRERSRGGLTRAALLGGLAGEEPPDRGPGPEELAEAAELAGRVRRAVADLPRGQRAAVTLFYLAGLAQRDVAAHLGISVGAVKTRLHQARATLRQDLAGWYLATEEAMDAESRADEGFVAVRVADVRFVAAAEDSPFRCAAILEELGGGSGGAAARRLPIWIGTFEGEALSLALEGVALPRPYLYRLTNNLLEAAGARVRAVRIDLLDERVFRAEVVIEGAPGPATVDARPSDALNLALLAGVPISAAARLFAERAEREAAEPERWSGEWPVLTGAASHGAAEVAARVRASFPG